MSVLFEPAITHFGKTKHSLDDPDRMLDFSPHLRFASVFRPLDLVHNTAVAIAPVDKVSRSQCVLTDHRPLAAVGLVTLHPGLLPMQEIRQDRAVGDIGRRRRHRVDQLAAAVHPEMRLHPELAL